MCGIVGVFNHNTNINSLIESLKHRGPDESGIYEDGALKLGHTRLSIIDLKNGKQPMQLGDLVISFDGEIYNHLTLRKTHLRDFEFKTTSDTETILALYQKMGAKFLNVLDGMFAMAIYEKSKERIFFARDRAGEKPLYYLKTSNFFAFASELNTLKKFDLKIDEKAIKAYLRLGFFAQNSAYKDVCSVLAGNYGYLNLKNGNFVTKPFFSMIEFYGKKSKLSQTEALLLLEDKLKKSVKSRLFSSDVEVGAFLSGGIDSSLVVALASGFKENLRTFTISFDGSYDEAPLARLVAQKFNTNHQEICLKFDIAQDLEKILGNYGQPFFDSSAIPSYFVSKEARKYVKVALCGDGADELFGGYRRYVLAKNIRLFRPFGFLSKILFMPKDKKSGYNYFFRALKLVKANGKIEKYLRLTNDIIEGFSENFELVENYGIESFLEKISSTPLKTAMLHDFDILLRFDLLVKMDIASMANSLEIRSPFLAKDILEFAPSLDDRLKVKGLQTKFILRQLAQKYLPQDLINAPKRGFEVPLKSWVENDLKEMIFDNLQKNSYVRKFVKGNFLQNLLENKVKIPGEKRAKILWNLLCLESWHKNI